MRTETAGWTGGEDKEIQSTGQLDFDLRNKQGRWGRMSTITKSTKPI